MIVPREIIYAVRALQRALRRCTGWHGTCIRGGAFLMLAWLTYGAAQLLAWALALAWLTLAVTVYGLVLLFA